MHPVYVNLFYLLLLLCIVATILGILTLLPWLQEEDHENHLDTDR